MISKQKFKTASPSLVFPFEILSFCITLFVTRFKELCLTLRSYERLRQKVVIGFMSDWDSDCSPSPRLGVEQADAWQRSADCRQPQPLAVARRTACCMHSVVGCGSAVHV